MQEFFKFIVDKGILELIIYIVAGAFLYHVFQNYLAKHIKIGLRKKRQETIKRILLNILKTIIIVIILIKVLSIFGVNVTSILAGIEILSAVIGLALQDVMKDYLAGAFILLEDQYDIGDYVEINGFEGTIKNVSLRSTVITNMYGEIKIISNRTISEVNNKNKKLQEVVIDIPIPYELSTKKIDKILEDIKKRCDEEVENTIGEMAIWGLNEFGDSALKYRVVISAKPNTQWAAKRQIYRIIKEEYEKNKISIPYNIVEVKNGNK